MSSDSTTEEHSIKVVRNKYIRDRIGGVVSTYVMFIIMLLILGHDALVYQLAGLLAASTAFVIFYYVRSKVRFLASHLEEGIELTRRRFISRFSIDYSAVTKVGFRIGGIAGNRLTVESSDGTEIVFAGLLLPEINRVALILRDTVGREKFGKKATYILTEAELGRDRELLLPNPLSAESSNPD